MNLGRLTCSCPDFEGRRAAFSSDDIRRVCKHIGATLDETGALLSYDEIAQALIKNRTRERVHYGVLDERFFRFRDGPDEVLVGLRAGSEWITVVTRRGTRKRLQRYKRYGYSLAEDRWSYGSAPFKEGEMKAAIFAIYAAASLRSTSAAYPPS